MFELLDIRWSHDEDVTEERPRRRHNLHCLCGRFAKWGGDRHYYNGWWNCYSYTVLCSRCGEVTVECV